MGNLGCMGLMGAEIEKFSSEQNKNNSTLLKNSSEIKKFISELFYCFSGGNFCTSKKTLKHR